MGPWVRRFSNIVEIEFWGQQNIRELIEFTWIQVNFIKFQKILSSSHLLDASLFVSNLLRLLFGIRLPYDGLHHIPLVFCHDFKDFCLVLDCLITAFIISHRSFVTTFKTFVSYLTAWWQPPSYPTDLLSRLSRRWILRPKKWILLRLTGRRRQWSNWRNQTKGKMPSWQIPQAHRNDLAEDGERGRRRKEEDENDRIGFRMKSGI